MKGGEYDIGTGHVKCCDLTEELPEFIRRKRANWEIYDEMLAGFELARLLQFRDGTSSKPGQTQLN